MRRVPGRGAGGGDGGKVSPRFVFLTTQESTSRYYPATRQLKKLRLRARRLRGKGQTLLGPRNQAVRSRSLERRRPLPPLTHREGFAGPPLRLSRPVRRHTDATAARPLRDVKHPRRKWAAQRSGWGLDSGDTAAAGSGVRLAEGREKAQRQPQLGPGAQTERNPVTLGREPTLCEDGGAGALA